MQRSQRISPGQKTVLLSALLAAGLVLGLTFYLLYGKAAEPLLDATETAVITVP